MHRWILAILLLSVFTSGMTAMAAKKSNAAATAVVAANDGTGNLSKQRREALVEKIDAIRVREFWYNTHSVN